MAGLFAAAPAIAAQSPSYVLTPAGTINYSNCRFPPNAYPNYGGVAAISDNGEFTGWYCTENAQGTMFTRAYHSHGDRLIDLGTPPLSPGYDYSSITPNDINNSGTIVGSWANFHNNGAGTSAGFVYTNLGGLNMSLPSLAGPTFANAINARGQVTGNSGSNAVILFRGAVTDLGVPTGYTCSVGYAINSMGHIAGETCKQVEPGHIVDRAALWNGSWHDLGFLPGYDGSRALSLNDHDEVVGLLFFGAPSFALGEAFFWAAGQMHALPGGGPAQATAINNAGDIVGQNGGGAVLWRDGTAYELDGLISSHDRLMGRVHLDSATDINNHGEIAAHGCYTSGRLSGLCDGFILSRTPEVASH